MLFISFNTQCFNAQHTNYYIESKHSTVTRLMLSDDAVNGKARLLINRYICNVKCHHPKKNTCSSRLELNMELPSSVPGTSVGASTVVSQEQDELTQRLARLRQAE